MEEKKSNKIFHIIIFALIAVVLLFNVFSYFGASLLLPGQELREITGVDPQTNHRISLDVSQGTVILNIWATWCGACIAEMPELNKIAGKYKVYGAIKPAFKYEVYREVKPNFKSVIAQDEFFENLYISVLPTTLLIQDGVIKKVHVGTLTADFAEEWVKD
ncbi:TlpA family protein disulfide reductase [bacterium]|nr:TlpA family protein disulfide reductase [bacterium]MBP5590491.1 TlpA family protein disulfide reductase [bacterium]